MITAAVEAAVGTLRRLRLAFARDTSPALWAAVGTVAHLQSLDLYTAPDEIFTDWEDLSPWELSHLNRLALHLDRYWHSQDLEGIFTFLERCKLTGLQELEIHVDTRRLNSLENGHALGRFLSSQPAIIRLTAHGPPDLSSNIILHALAEMVVLSRAPNRLAAHGYSPRIHTLWIKQTLFKDDDRRLLDFLHGLSCWPTQHAQLECVKLYFKDKDRMRSEILPIAHRLHEKNITLLDANDEPYHV
jgi:hypothetical protein